MDQFVQLPAEVLGASQKYETINLLATIARFALPGRWPDGALERDLDAKFAGHPSIDFQATAVWLASLGIQTQPLADQVNQIAANGDAETLHQLLQQQNAGNSLQLLALQDASKLAELLDDGSSRPLWSRAEACLLLRFGFSSDQPYAYYSASLPGDGRRPIKLTWPSVVAAGITAALAVLPPTKPLDLESVANAMHIMEQALQAASQAHAHIQDLLAQQAAPAGQ